MSAERPRVSAGRLQGGRRGGVFVRCVEFSTEVLDQLQVLTIGNYRGDRKTVLCQWVVTDRRESLCVKAREFMRKSGDPGARVYAWITP